MCFYINNLRYDPYAFKEKSNYKPNVKLEYVDNKGRELSQKEVFIIVIVNDSYFVFLKKEKCLHML